MDREAQATLWLDVDDQTFEALVAKAEDANRMLADNGIGAGNIGAGEIAATLLAMWAEGRLQDVGAGQ